MSCDVTNEFLERSDFVRLFVRSFQTRVPPFGVCVCARVCGSHHTTFVICWPRHLVVVVAQGSMLHPPPHNPAVLRWFMSVCVPSDGRRADDCSSFWCGKPAPWFFLSTRKTLCCCCCCGGSGCHHCTVTKPPSINSPAAPHRRCCRRRITTTLYQERERKGFWFVSSFLSLYLPFFLPSYILFFQL